MANSAIHPSGVGKRVVIHVVHELHELRGEDQAWLIGALHACWLHTMDPIVRYRGLQAAASLRRGTTVNASQLPLPRLYSAAVQDCNWRYIKWAIFTFTFYLYNSFMTILEVDALSHWTRVCRCPKQWLILRYRQLKRIVDTTTSVLPLHYLSEVIMPRP